MKEILKEFSDFWKLFFNAKINQNVTINVTKPCVYCCRGYDIIGFSIVTNSLHLIIVVE